ALALSVWESTEYWATGKSPGPLGTANRMSAPYQAFAGSTGMFVVGAANQKLWLIFCDVIGHPELKDDPRYTNNIDRVQRRSELAEELKPLFQTRPAEEWVELFLAAGVPAGPINDYSVALDNEHVRHRQAVIEIDHPVEGSFKALGFPAKLSDTPASVRRHPPLLGEHTAEILAERGQSEGPGKGTVPA
ncbi:MAG: CoA transferase, partial [Brevundimonas sp.]|nr:CoA transferase [Brevundimonas sp.]